MYRMLYGFRYRMLYVKGSGVVFFFKQKTAYEVRISDWSSDVCSSDLTSDCESPGSTPSREGARSGARQHDKRMDRHHQKPARRRMHSCPRARRHEQIGGESCRESVCQYV